MSYHKISVSLLAFFILSLVGVVPVAAQSKCNLPVINENILTLPVAAGQLIYVTKATYPYHLESTTDSFRTMASEAADNAQLSPDRLWLAWTERKTGEDGLLLAEVVVQEINGESVFRIPLYIERYRSPHAIYWLNSNEIVTVYVEPTELPNYYFFSVVNPFNNTTRYVHSLPDAYTPEDILPAIPFIPETSGEIYGGMVRISPNGNYIMTMRCQSGNCHQAVYDLTNERYLDVPEQIVAQRWADVWFNETGIIFMSHDIDTASKVFAVYDVVTHQIREIYRGAAEAFINSVSPDEEYALLTERGQIKILHLSNGTVEKTCLEAPVWGLQWSLDSRFLAFNLLSGQKNILSSGIYIYDILATQVYRVYSNDAYVVGWAANS